MKKLLLWVFAVFAVGAHAGSLDAVMEQFKEAYSQILSTEEYEKAMFGPEIDKINHEISALGKKPGSGDQKKIEKLNKKLEEFSTKAERDLKRRMELVESAAKSVTPGMKNTYSPLRNAIRENLDFAFNCQNKVIRQLEKKEKDLASQMNREKDKNEKEQTGLREKADEYRSEIGKRNELCRKIREAQRKLADDDMLEFLKTLSFAAPPQG